MIDINILLTLPNTGGLSGESVMDQWRTDAPEIASIEHTSITGRMPEDTGTLILSTTQEVNPDKNTLVRIYTDPDAQLSGPWNRVYAQYQEGPPLGHTTYTRQTPHFFYDVLTDDLPQIAAWAEASAQRGATSMVSAANAGATPMRP
jgi:hypothetical protein